MVYLLIFGLAFSVLHAISILSVSRISMKKRIFLAVWMTLFVMGVPMFFQYLPRPVFIAICIVAIGTYLTLLFSQELKSVGNIALRSQKKEFRTRKSKTFRTKAVQHTEPLQSTTGKKISKDKDNKVFREIIGKQEKSEGSPIKFNKQPNDEKVSIEEPVKASKAVNKEEDLSGLLRKLDVLYKAVPNPLGKVGKKEQTAAYRSSTTEKRGAHLRTIKNPALSDVKPPSSNELEEELFRAFIPLSEDEKMNKNKTMEQSLSSAETRSTTKVSKMGTASSEKGSSKTVNLDELFNHPATKVTLKAGIDPAAFEGIKQPQNLDSKVASDKDETIQSNSSLENLFYGNEAATKEAKSSNGLDMLKEANKQEIASVQKEEKAVGSIVATDMKHQTSTTDKKLEVSSEELLSTNVAINRPTENVRPQALQTEKENGTLSDSTQAKAVDPIDEEELLREISHILNAQISDEASEKEKTLATTSSIDETVVKSDDVHEESEDKEVYFQFLMLECKELLELEDYQEAETYLKGIAIGSTDEKLRQEALAMLDIVDKKQSIRKV